MAGMRRCVQTRTLFSFPANLPVGSSAAFPLTLHIDATAWVSGVLEVILYTKSITGTGATATIAVLNEAIASDGRTANAQGGQYVADVPITAGNVANTSPPLLYVDAFTAPIGGRVSVILILASGSAAASGDVEFEAWITARDA
jgi:hypothetical protein